MNRILIAYASHSGSTQEIAHFLDRQLSALQLGVDVKPISDVSDLLAYDFIIAGGLLYRFGWHPEIIQFLKKNLAVLRTKKVALFVTGLRLVKTPECDQAAYPIFIDPAILKPAAGKATGKQKKGLLDGYTTMRGYLRAALPTIEEIKPVSLSFFCREARLAYPTLFRKMYYGAADAAHRQTTRRFQELGGDESMGG